MGARPSLWLFTHRKNSYFPSHSLILVMKKCGIPQKLGTLNPIVEFDMRYIFEMPRIFCYHCHIVNNGCAAN